MTGSTNGNLLYRATKDGFTKEAFDTKCKGKSNTVTIIRANDKYVFGGYTTAKWTRAANNNTYMTDSKAFIFSLRRNGVSFSQKFGIIHDQFAVHCGPDNIFRFGGYNGGHDIGINIHANKNTGSWTNFCASYECPIGYTHGTNETQSFLAGKYQFFVNEIEVYQI